MPQKHFKITIALTILIIFLIRIFYSVPNAPLLDCDAILSVEVARSIIETGIPLKISGEFYPRDYLAHYLLAGSIFLFGDNPVGYIIPNLIFSVLVLILLYFFAKEFTKSKMVIFLTIFFVGISTVENTYAVNPRSYMQFQFFFLLTVFLFYKGFVEKNNNNNKEKIKRYKILTIFSYIASCLSHLSGLILMPIFGLWILVKNRKFYKDKLILIFLLAIILFSVFLFCVQFPNTPINQNAIYFDLSNEFKFRVPFSHFFGEKNFDIAIAPCVKPFGISFNLFPYLFLIFLYSPILFFLFFINILNLTKKKSYKLFYIYYIFFVSFLIISCMTRWVRMRYILSILPIFILLSLIGLNNLINFLSDKIDSKKNKIKNFIWILILVIFFIFNIIIKNCNINSAYGFNSSFRNTKRAVSHIIKNKKKNDILVCNNVSLCSFYLKNFDYQIKQEMILKNNKIEWSKLDYQIKPNHYNLNFINSIDKLEKVLNNNDRVWIFLDQRNFGVELYEYIKNNFQLKYQNPKDTNRIYFYEKNN